MEKKRVQVKKKKKKKKEASGSIWTLFTNADATDLWLMAFGGVAAVGDGLTAPVMSFITSKVFNNVGRGLSTSPSLLTHAIKRNVLTLLCLAACSLVASFLEGYCWTRTAERQTSRLRARYLKAVLRQDVEYFDLEGMSSADVVIGISSDSLVIQDFLSEQLPNFIVSVTTFLGCYTLAFILVWRLALVASPSIILLVVPGIVYGKMLMVVGRKMRAEYAVAGTAVEQAVSSIRTVYSFAGEERTVAEYSSALGGSTQSGLRLGLVKGIAIGGNNIMIAIWALIIWYGGKLVMYHGTQGGSVFVVGTAINLGGMRLGTALSGLKSFTEAIAAAEHVAEVAARLPKIDSDSEDGLVLEATRGEVEFRGVAFAYPSRPKNKIFSNFSLTVPMGKTAALVGGSGSGKSTVIALLERFYDPDGGEVLLDGTDIRRLTLKWLRSQMGLVSQEPLLFSMSVRENIMFGKEDASMEEVAAAAEAANVHQFISQLTDGYETKVGEKGIQMSGGQKQRIAIARAIIKSPKILLLDEATSALDSESEQVVQEALDKASAGRTTIVVAHRLSTIRNADMIAVVKDGQVAETGSHDDLMRDHDGLYSNLVLSQLTATATREQVKVSVSSSAAGVDYVIAPSFKSKTTSAGEVEEEQGDSKNKLGVHKPTASLPRLLMLSASEWKHALFGCLGAIVVGGTQPFHVILVGNIVSLYFGRDHGEIISKTRTYSLIFLSLSVVSISSGVAQHYNFGALGEWVTKRVREQTLSKILTFEVGWFDMEENSTGAICTRLAKDAYLVKSLVGDQVSLLVQTVSALAFTYSMGFVISWRMALVMVVIQPLAIVCVYCRKILLKRMSRKAREVQSDSSKFAAEAVSDLRTVTAFSSQDRILRFFQRAQDGPRRESIRQSWTAGIFLGIAQSLTRCTVALVFWYGSKLVAEGTITPKAFFQTYLVLNKTARIIADAASKTNDLSKGAGAVQSVFALLNRPTSIEPEDPNGHRPEKLAGNVEFQGVDFAYPARPQAIVLERFSLSMYAGKSTALVGRSGCGKSTVIGLVERFYDPVRGTIRIDNRDIKSYHLRSLRRHIAMVGQQPTLFSRSVRENIMYGIEGVTEAEVEDAARVANAHGFISGLQHGYETRCGDRGLQLSGGQKQRIAIARAVLRNPSILLLDEATSALDNESEKLVQEALEKVMVGRTCIVVAHRLGTIRDCDLIAVMDGGTVVEAGTHTSLLQKGPGGSYHELVKLQQGTH